MDIYLIVVAAGLLASIAALAMMSRNRQARLLRRHQHIGTKVEVSGGELNVVELGGQKYGPCLVLLHGAGASLEDLRVSIGERLSRDSRVLLIDRPGAGWSDQLKADVSPTPEAQAVALNQVLTTLGVDQPIIVGHDVGGTVALAYALSYPEDVGGLVVISPVSHPSGVGLTFGQSLSLFPVIGTALAWIFVPIFGFWSQKRSLVRAFAPQIVPPDYYDGVAAELAMRPACYCAAAKERAALSEFLEDQSQYYGQVRAPVVVIAGEDDHITDLSAHADCLARELPDGRWVVLNEVGHMPHHISPNVILFEINRMAEKLWAEIDAR